MIILKNYPNLSIIRCDNSESVNDPPSAIVSNKLFESFESLIRF